MRFKSEAPYATRIHFGYFLESKPGSYHFSCIPFLGALTLKNWKMQFYSGFLTPSVNSCGASNWELKKVQNRRLFRKHRILPIKIKTLFFGLVSWSSDLNLQISMEFDKEFA